MLAVRERPRIINLLNFRVLFEKCCDGATRTVVLFHAQGQSLRHPEHEPGIEWRKDSTSAGLNEAQPLGIRVVVQNDDPADPARMSVQIFSGGMHHYVNTECERGLE